jgi:hypothetical protein
MNLEPEYSAKKYFVVTWGNHEFSLVNGCGPRKKNEVTINHLLIHCEFGT